MKKVVFIAISLLFITQNIFGNSWIEHFLWQYSIGYRHYSINNSNKQQINNDGAIIAFGGGVVNNKNLFSLTANMLLGPYSNKTKNQLTLDYEGTGVSFLWGYNWQNTDKQRFAHGTLLGVNYTDVTGHSFALTSSALTKNSSDNSLQQIPQQAIHANMSALVVGFFYGVLPHNFSQKSTLASDLTTKINGSLLSLVVEIPIQQSITTKQSTLNFIKNNKIITQPALKNQYSKKDHNYIITLAIAVLIGT